MDFNEIWTCCNKLSDAVGEMSENELERAKQMRSELKADNKITKRDMQDQLNAIKNINLLINRLSNRYDSLEQVLESAKYDEQRIEICMDYAKDVYGFMKNLLGLEGAQEVFYGAFGDFSEQIINEFYDGR